ncbi:MAG: cysteine desulfurase [Oscillospiraceae bacterium]|jgi:cysteine desulfurase|nr:cysteine desulfurase [Oscillospiraceae bacterium]
MEVYLDNSATTPLCPEAVAAMEEELTAQWGNPSSLHRVGLEAGQLLAESRRAIATRLSCDPTEVIFTSGGTEGNNLAILGAAHALRRRGRRIVTSSVEHSSVTESTRELASRGFEVINLPVDRSGRVSEQDLMRAVNGETILVSLMAVNSEVGTMEPVEAMRRAVQMNRAPALIHCDAVQAFGKLPVIPSRLGVDLLTVSSHKIHGPKGVGALYVRRGVRLQPLVYGGGQEGKLRPGTEPMPAIAGFAAAARALPNPNQALERVTPLRDRLVQGLLAMNGVRVNSPQNALPYVINFSVPGLRSEPMLNFLSERGIYVSSGSACSKGKKSRVLQAMGLSDAEVASALRVSLSRYTTWEEIDALLYGLGEALAVLTRG